MGLSISRAFAALIPALGRSRQRSDSEVSAFCSRRSGFSDKPQPALGSRSAASRREAPVERHRYDDRNGEYDGRP